MYSSNELAYVNLHKEGIMKQGLVTLVILLTFSTSGNAQEVNGIWLNILFPEVKAYMESMDARIAQLETQLTALREDYIRYQNLQNLSIKYISLASVSFSQVGIYYNTQDEQSSCNDVFGPKKATLGPIKPIPQCLSYCGFL